MIEKDGAGRLPGCLGGRSFVEPGASLSVPFVVKATADSAKKNFSDAEQVAEELAEFSI